MPAYNAQSPSALYPGQPITLVNNAAVDSGITTTEQFSMPPSSDSSGATVMIVNTTNQNATGQYSWIDVTGDYVSLSGCIIPAGTALAYNLAAGWMRFTFSVAPTSGSLVVAR